jgi:hypothetical protein
MVFEKKANILNLKWEKIKTKNFFFRIICPLEINFTFNTEQILFKNEYLCQFLKNAPYERLTKKFIRKISIMSKNKI